MTHIVIIAGIFLVCLSPFIGMLIGMHYDEPAHDVALYGILSTVVVGLLVIAAISLMAANAWI